MRSDRIMRSKIYRFLDYVLRLILLNALIIIPSFSFSIIYINFFQIENSPWEYITLIPILLWFFPSFVAATSVIKQYETNETNTIFKDFFKSFGKNYLKALIFSILIIVLIYVFYNSLNFFTSNITKGIIYILGFILTISFTMIIVAIIVHIPLIMAYFTNMRIVEIVKLAFIMAFKDLLTSLLLGIILVAFLILSFTIEIILITIGMALPIYLIVKISFKKYIRLYNRIENK